MQRTWPRQAHFNALFSQMVMKEKDKARKMALVAVMCKFALEMPALFPEGSLRVLRRDAGAVLSLSRAQVGSLVAHMFFCTFLPSLHLDHVRVSHSQS